MKSLNEFREYYYSTIVSTVNALEVYRRSVLNQMVTYCISACSAAAVAGFLILYFVPRPANLYINFVILAVLLIAIGCIYIFTPRDFIYNFKERIIKKIVSFVDEGLSYSRNGHVSESYFMESGIFTRIPSRTSGEDLVSGRIGSTQIEFSELNVEYRREYWDYDEYGLSNHGRYDWFGRRRTYSYHTLFRGLFFVAHINKRFRARTVVLPDVAESLLGNIGSKLQSLNAARGQLVKMDDPEFEKAFVVYSEEQSEPRLILTPEMMKRILDFKRNTNRKICLSFEGSRVYIAIAHERNFLEPSIFQSLLDFGLFEGYFRDLQLLAGIVEGLKLEEISVK